MKKGLYGINPLFLLTLISSAFSSAKGIADFLLIGPCKLLTRDGPLSGILTCGYLLLTINIFLCFLLKFELLAFAYGGYGEAYGKPYDDKVSFLLLLGGFF